MKKHAGAYLEGCIASERSNWVGELLHYPLRVGRIQVGVCVVPACDRCGADIVNVKFRADNLQGLLPYCSRHPVPWPCSKSRARDSRRFALSSRSSQGHLARPNEALTRV
jgi:hypothetical protein